MKKGNFKSRLYLLLLLMGCAGMAHAQSPNSVKGSGTQVPVSSGQLVAKTNAPNKSMVATPSRTVASTPNGATRMQSNNVVASPPAAVRPGSKSAENVVPAYDKANVSTNYQRNKANQKMPDADADKLP